MVSWYHSCPPYPPPSPRAPTQDPYEEEPRLDRLSACSQEVAHGPGHAQELADGLFFCDSLLAPAPLPSSPFLSRPSAPLPSKPTSISSQRSALVTPPLPDLPLRPPRRVPLESTTPLATRHETEHCLMPTRRRFRLPSRVTARTASTALPTIPSAANLSLRRRPYQLFPPLHRPLLHHRPLHLMPPSSAHTT